MTCKILFDSEDVKVIRKVSNVLLQAMASARHQEEQNELFLEAEYAKAVMEGLVGDGNE